MGPREGQHERPATDLQYHGPLTRRSLAAHELEAADVVISPDIRKIGSSSFERRNLAILEGEQAALAAMPKIREKIVEREARLRKAVLAN